ncbi:lipase family protein [Marinimicrobium locisalis]|uniref:lipase family protein n=1 Tax=Marinimicrobium locisalis TaxID=546022 RepID=UPI003221C5B3
MNEMTPKAAAQLADEVYDVWDHDFLAAYLNKPELFGTPATGKKLEAQIGAMLWKSPDAFGVFSRGGGAYSNDLFLVFRGTSKARDWLSNASIGIEFSKTGLPVHIGFNQIFSSVLAGIKEFLAKKTSATGTIHCVGHSLGGAVANLAADWLKKNHANSVKLYTFGAPRPGVFWFARTLGTRLKEQNIYRVYHKTDPVPMLPLYPFTHAPVSNFGHQVYSSDAIVSAEAHAMGRYRKSVSQTDWAGLHGTLAPFHIDHVIEQWLRSDISPNRADSRIWEWLNSAIIWVLKKVAIGAMAVVQNTVVGLYTIADKLAWILKSGIDLTKEGGFWVERLMRKILQVLGMGLEGIKSLTQAFIRRVLLSLMEQMTLQARAAIRSLFGPR